MRTLTVALGERSYPVHIGEGLLERVDTLLPSTRSRHAVVVTNPTVAHWYLSPLRDALSRAGVRCDVIVIPEGEAHKDWTTLNSIHTRLIELGAERSSLLIALGGGVVGDVAGFAAASYQRGMPLLQIPTTLLAQVDSSVGGKTAINHPLGKNMVGAFYQPSAVIIDTSTLATLPDRELAAGVAEVIKYGAACDAGFFAWIEARLDDVRSRDGASLEQAVFESCRIKAAIVAGDERETGERALLNFGHTFGHAIEAASGYDGSWLHGEAVSAGMVLASELSTRVSGLAGKESARIRALLERARLPVRAPAIGTERYLELMARDKKVAAGKMRFVILESLGHAVLHANVRRQDVVAALERCIA